MKKFSFLSWVMVTTCLLGTSGGYAMNVGEDAAKSRPIKSAGSTVAVEQSDIQVYRGVGSDTAKKVLVLDFKNAGSLGFSFDNLEREISKDQSINGEVNKILVKSYKNVRENSHFLSIMIVKIPSVESITFNDIDPKLMNLIEPFGTYLRQHHSKTLKYLDLVGLLMNEFTLNYLFCNDCASSLQLSGLNLSNTKTKGKSVGVALSSQPLEWLDGSDNGLEDADIAKIVSEINSKGTAPAAASTLTTLILSKNPFTDNAIGDLRTLSGKFPKLTADRFNLGETKMTLQGRRAVLNTLPQ